MPRSSTPNGGSCAGKATASSMLYGQQTTDNRQRTTDNGQRSILSSTAPQARPSRAKPMTPMHRSILRTRENWSSVRSPEQLPSHVATTFGSLLPTARSTRYPPTARARLSMERVCTAMSSASTKALSGVPTGSSWPSTAWTRAWWLTIRRSIPSSARQPWHQTNTR